MVWSILHRMIFMELFRVFFLALLALTGMLLMGGLFAEASQRGLGPGQLLAAIPLIIPSTLPYTLPATTLFATCVVYGRLAHDNEILAVKASGIHLIHVVWPALLLGLGASLATLFLYLDVIPSTHHELRTRFLRDVEELLYGMLKKDGCIRHPRINYTIYVKRVQGRKLLDAQFMRRDPSGQHYDIIARAREAELLVDMKNKQIFVHMRHCYISTDNGNDEAYVEDKVWPVEIPNDIVPAGKMNARSMTWWELWQRIHKLNNERQQIQDDIAKHQAEINASRAPDHFAPHVRDKINERRACEMLLNQTYTEMHARPALSFGCLCFVLVGCPVGIWLSRSDYLSSFIACFLPIVLLYYPLLLCGINMAKLGRIEPTLALWAANGLMAVIALFLFRRLLRN